MKLIAMALCSIVLAGCTQELSSRRALEGAGYTNINMTGFRVWGCDEKDIFHDGFEAVGPTGRRVTGVVCAGWFKGSTIRLD